MARWLLLIAACTQLAWAQTATPTPAPAVTPMRAPSPVEALKQRLGLSDDQVKNIEATMERVRTSLKDKAERMSKLEREIAAMQQDPSKKDQVVAKIRESEQIRFAMLYIDLLGSRKIEALLTPEQLEKVRQMRGNRR